MKLLLKDFNFSAFSDSVGWCGFFERNGPFSFEVVEKALSAFHRCFGSSCSDFFVLSALCIDTAEKDEGILSHYRQAFSRIEQSGILMPIDEEMIAYFAGDTELPYRYIQFNEHRYIDDLSRLLMAHGNVRGEVWFFVNATLNVAVYPHSDTGYGVIGLNGDMKHAQKFLQFVKSFSEFDTHEGVRRRGLL